MPNGSWDKVLKLPVRYCPLCGSSVERRQAFGKVRPVCAACGYVHFHDPKVAVGVIVQQNGKVLLTRRNHEPRMGLWSFPSGYMDAGEVPEEAAVREAQEETGLKVAIQRLLGVYAQRGERTIFIAYAARIVGGELKPGPEAMEVSFFDPQHLPELAFPHDRNILGECLAIAGMTSCRWR